MSTVMRHLQRFFTFVLLTGLVLNLAGPAAKSSAAASNPPPGKPIISHAVKHDKSPALREIKANPPEPGKLAPSRQIPLRPLPGASKYQAGGKAVNGADPVRQNQPGAVDMPAPDFNFEGLSNFDNSNTLGYILAPPDTMGVVGFDPASGHKYYVQWVNVVFQIWDVTANPPTVIVGPTAGNQLWQGFGGACETNNDGDIIVLFDRFANRWLMSQFALNFYTDFHQCFAISETADPTGAWYRYDFMVSNSKMNDYPKIGVWPDGYYMSANQFAATGWGGSGVWAFERDAMLLGLEARAVYFDLENDDGGLLPSDLDGYTPPTTGAPNIFAKFSDDAWGYPFDQLRLFAFHVDWSDLGSSSFTPVTELATAPFNSSLCPSNRDCVDQPNGQRLDVISDRLMYRLAYRNFGDHAALVVNHTVNADGDGTAGVRWYELRDSGSGWGIYQQGTYSPDSDHRWMGSVAQDASGNIALGYSVSSVTTFPSVRYAGRLAGDPLGQLSQDETELVAGAYSQENVFRWGDYSMMVLDPTDDCNFWYTQEYVSGPNPWQWGNWFTRIGSFKFPTCTAGPAGNMQGYVGDLMNDMQPIPGARIDLGNGIQTVTDETGHYQFIHLPVGVYTATVWAYGYLPSVVGGLNILEGETLMQDFALAPAPEVQVTGLVSDDGHGWPLYARIHISTLGHSEDVFTNPASGAYDVILYQGTAYTFLVEAISPGYVSQTRAVTPGGGDVENFSLVADPITCYAPGYAPQFVYFEDFEASNGGFAVDPTSNNPSWEWGLPTSGPNKAYSGENVWATNLAGNYNDDEWSMIVSPVIDLSGLEDRAVIISWYQWLQTEEGFDYAMLEVSKDGGNYWYPVYGPVSGNVTSQWTKISLDMGYNFGASQLRLRFRLVTDGSVTYPGYYIDDVAVAVSVPLHYYYQENFEFGDGGYTVSANPGHTTSWEWGTPTRGPGSAHSGINVWATNLDGNYEDDEDGYLTSPTIDLSLPLMGGGGGGEGGMILAWWQWLQTEAHYDYASLEITVNDSVTWTQVYTVSGTYTNDEWVQEMIWLDSSFHSPDFKLRFRLQSDDTVSYPGWYIDDTRIYDPPEWPPVQPCATLEGGLLFGQVSDANSGAGLVGALLQADTGQQALTFATAQDPNLDDGYYILFTPAGERAVSASLRGYGTDVHLPIVPLNGVVREDYSLAAGMVAANPLSLYATLEMGISTTLPLTLTNTGGMDASFKLSERDLGSMPVLSGAPLRYKYGRFSPGFLHPNALAANDPKRPIPIHAPPWTDVANYPMPVMDNTAAWLDGKVYSVGGITPGGTTNEAFVYDPNTDAWSPIAPMHHARAKPSAVFIEGLLYVTGGWDDMGNTDASLEIYVPETDQWAIGPGAPLGVTSAPAVALDGKMYLFGGCADGFCTPSDQSFVYDPVMNMWSRIADYPQPISWNACGVVEDKIYCAGGVNAGTEVAAAYVYDPALDAWTQIADMPQTQWGMGYIAANGKLYVSGGVTDNFNTITNETFAYDPTLDAWSPDANSNHSLYRGASACGFYRIGGSTGGFSPDPSVELYSGLTDCGALPDAPWLFEVPITGTLPAFGGYQVISVTLDTSVPEIVQPGEYQADLNIKTDTPYTNDPVQVTMNVLPPANWGKLAGNVSGLSRCDEPPGMPLAGATIVTENKLVIKTDELGNYSYWLEEGGYILDVWKEGYVESSASITITAGLTVTQDFMLRLNAPCLTIQPYQLDLSVLEGSILPVTITLTNLAAGQGEMQVLETPYLLTSLTAVGGQTGNFHIPATTGPASILVGQGAGTAGNTPLAPDSGWYSALPLETGGMRYAHAQCAETPNSFYVISGVDRNFSVTGKTWRYDADTNTWTQLKPLPVGQEGPTAVCWLGKIYVMGGGGTDQFYIYDIATDTWMPGAPLPRGVAGAATGAWGNKVFLIGGDNDFYPASGVSDQVNVYDIAAGVWITDGMSMPTATSFPGYVQAGPYVMVVGGWGILSPDSNVDQTMRYDMIHDVWETGPFFYPAQADFALALTDRAIYAIGGDKDGGGFFDVSDELAQFEWPKWSTEMWGIIIDPLPLKVTANNAGFCANVFDNAAIWSVGGGDPATGNVYGETFFHPWGKEQCYSLYSNVTWLQELSGSNIIMEPDSQGLLVPTIDTTGLTPGEYTATIVFVTNDPANPVILIPIRLVVLQMYKAFLPVLSKP